MLYHKFLPLLHKFLAHACICLIWLIRPLLGPMHVCPLVKSGFYETGCTQFAVQQLEQQPFNLACKAIIKRLLQCHPFRLKKKP